MKKNVTRKSLWRTIQDSLGRFVAILAIIALGSAIFVGLVITKADMVATGQKYMDGQHMFDLRLLSTYGWSQEEVDEVAQMPGVEFAEGMISMDVMGSQGEGETAVYKLHSIPDQVNKVYLLGGRMPENPDECLVDGFHATDAVIGTEFTIAGENTQDTLESFTYHTYTVVGYVSTPLYMDMSRGTTSLGNGNVQSYVYLPKDAFRVEYFTDIAVTLEGSYAVYTTEFDDAMADFADRLKPQVTVLADSRFVQLKEDGEQEYADGLKEYESGKKEYEEARQEVLGELSDALSQLLDAQVEIDNNRATLEEGELQLQQGQALLDSQQAVLNTSRQTLLDAKAEAYSQMAKAYAELMTNYKSVYSGLQQVNAGLKEIDSGLAQLDDGIAQLESGLTQLEEGKKQLDLVINLKKLQIEAIRASLSVPMPDAALRAELEAQLAVAQQELAEYEAQRSQLEEMQSTYSAQLEELKQQRTQVAVQREELVKTRETLEAAMDQIDLGILELQSSQAQADNEFAAAEAQLQSGQLQLDIAQAELDSKKAELKAGLEALEAGQAELDAAWEEYEAGRQTAEEELNRAEQELREGWEKLSDARKTLDTMEPAEVFILDRNTNAGYIALDNNSDIVAGVARVFPAFFLLVAALVCITTMTRMVEEERMQIGTMKALGYSNFAIISKYLWYAGIAALAGCGLGVLLGSIVFPNILWQAYGIILNITPNVVIGFNWPLNLAVAGAYTAVILLVTWWCCRRNLKEVPAELLRPKAPTSGKKIFLEYLPFWKKMGFLNKVMLRNVFRYRQRMFMMLVGVGGCTALLLTGFGLRDSIMNIVSDQFGSVTTYDMGVYFSEVQTPELQEAFRQELRRELSDSLFYYQTSAELSIDGRNRDVSLVAAGPEIENFIHFHRGQEPLGLPEVGETFLSVGIAEMLDIRVGDTVELRDAELRHVTVTVAGIFDNHVQNYAIVLPETLEKAWDEELKPQMAYLNLRDTADIYETSAKITGMEGVLNVTVNEDVKNQVTGMLQALNMVVITVVVCAGALAGIVLYNLTNINITERIREIATLKVLGFQAAESAAYVFKENLLLSGMGTAVGLVGGKFLLDFVISQIQIDLVWFRPTFTWISALVSVVLTMVAACLVDFLLYFKLEKINMAEALKSVE